MTIFSRPAKRSQISIEAIAQFILKEWSESDLYFIQSRCLDFGQVGHSVRNDYGLWEFDNPLTQHWHQHEDCRNIVDGIDHSEDHPDNVSAEIIELVRSYLDMALDAEQ